MSLSRERGYCRRSIHRHTCTIEREYSYTTLCPPRPPPSASRSPRVTPRGVCVARVYAGRVSATVRGLISFRFSRLLPVPDSDTTIARESQQTVSPSPWSVLSLTVTHYVSLTELSAPFSAPCIPHTTKRQRLCMSLKPAPGVDPRQRAFARAPGPRHRQGSGGVDPRQGRARAGAELGRGSCLRPAES